ncbi:MAG: UDP-N-acetylmuramoyl-L-alanyl-D-glutamate--2,6-diaminopimelate ligase [Candidatus Peregrinibacteria bacterium]|nr:UDP-N-acetylmuramoyl-L-alanyl-D-glutamate--2,6-diaminopimelate ligase [Candidatus Peregrinibacteria bacterium]MDZ4245062.1 UDP-N-acetylmuramoyl-L-alanyl-D-glutamate--2,6-diaminopimelate ligase [Candidatus Gracilibacteria bacterium]
MDFVKKIFPDRHPFRLAYHKLKAVAAAVYYGFPASRMTVIGVTGTKGKTTTCHLIAKIFESSGHKVGMTTSTHFQIAGNRWVNKTKQNTPSPFVLQKMLRDMVKAGCTHAVLEVSSHAITQHRIYGVNVDTAVLTQIDEDHIEYHGSHKAYRGEKLKLFRSLSAGKRKANVKKVAVLNQDDQYYDEFKDVASDFTYIYGLNRGTCTAEFINLHAGGTEFVLKIPNHNERIVTKLVGKFNIYNTLAAISAALANGISTHAIKDALEDLEPIPGRQEWIDTGQDFSVVVDYAHTVDSLKQLCEIFKPLTKGKLILIFGCTGGGRDRSKRSKMGEVADKYADFIVLTDDDPYTEDRMEILKDIAKGIKREEGPCVGNKGLWLIPDRKEAIRLGLTVARKNDTVVIAGKGCEEVQAMGDKLIPWDDRVVARELLSRELELTLPGGEKVSGNKCFVS